MTGRATLMTFTRAFSTPDLRKKLLFTAGMIVLFRFGSYLPTPGISEADVKHCSGLAPGTGPGSGTGAGTASVLALLNVLSGNSLLRLSVFALAFTLATMLVTMVSGTAVIMWMGELITDRGIGNGMSVVLFTSVLAVIPGELEQIYLTKGIVYAAMAVIVIIILVGFVVFMEQAQRRVPVQYAKRLQGRRMYGGASTYLPLKVNQSGVVPVMFASSALYLPQLAASLFGDPSHPQGWVNWVNTYLSPTAAGVSYLYYLMFFLLIVAFAGFYASITFNPDEVADNMMKYGGFIPGIRPGRATAGYLGYTLIRLTVPGAVYLGMIAMFPMVALGLIGVGDQFLFSGVSLLIMVGVGLDTLKQIESQLQQHNYPGFLR